MVKQLILFQPNLKKTFKQYYPQNAFLNVSEFYYDTIQGEGIYIGYPAAFLRLQGCVICCLFCDSKEIWRHGTPHTFRELFELIRSDLSSKLLAGQHLVITGGSPLLQQERLYKFLLYFRSEFGFDPFIEIENECVIMPEQKLLPFIDCWNNSPKLTNSDIDFETRYKPDVINRMSQLPNSWFKFVISSEEDWNEIDIGFLMPKLIKKEQIILMPRGETRAELELYRPIAVQMAVENGVRYCTREHIIIWDKKIGV